MLNITEHVRRAADVYARANDRLELSGGEEIILQEVVGNDQPYTLGFMFAGRVFMIGGKLRYWSDTKSDEASCEISKIETLTGRNVAKIW